MLRGFIAGWRRWPGGEEAGRQVDEELRLHCELLALEYRERGLTEEAARAAARRRFGDVRRVRAECVEISRRSRPAVKLSRLFLLLCLAAVVALRAGGVDERVMQAGHVLMAIAMLGHLLLRLTGERAAGRLSAERSSPLSLAGPWGLSSVKAYDQHGRTPVERLLADEAHGRPRPAPPRRPDPPARKGAL